MIFMVSVIIPAYNEEKTIAQNVALAKKHLLVSEVIVVDDGSSDQTAERAWEAGAKVIRLSENTGKGNAMDQGARAARSDILCFLDADISGLDQQTLSVIFEPVISGRFDMFVGVRGRRLYFLNKILRFAPVLGGERALRKETWKLVPKMYKKNFQVEIALNYYTKKHGRRMGFTIIPNLSQITKEKKRGIVVGLYQRAKMILDILVISIRLYIFNIDQYNFKAKAEYVRSYPPEKNGEK